MANSKIPGPIGTYPIRIDSGTLSRTNMSQPGVIGLMNQASHAKVDHAKRALAIDIGQLILDITGIFDPSPISDGTNMLISLARGNWVDAVVSAVSIAPYIGDLSKTAKLPRYIKSVREAIRIAKFDFKWADALRTLFTKLTKALDECIKLAADVLPNSAKAHLKELKYEVYKFLDPIGGTTNKLAGSGKKADLRPSSNSTKSQRNIDRAKPPEKLDKKPENGYGSDRNNETKTAPDRTKQSQKSLAAAHPGEVSVDPTYVSEASIKRALRKSGTPEALATSKLIKRGKVKVNIVDTDPFKMGAAGRGSFAPDTDVYIALDKVKNARSAAGITSHEAKHILQKVTPSTYSKVHEFEAYKWEREAGFLNLTDQKIIDLINSSPLYKHLPGTLP